MNARSSYRCAVYVGPGEQPNNSADFHQVASSWCDGHTVHSQKFSGVLASVNTAKLAALFPISDFGANLGAQESNGRPNTNRFAFTARIVVTTASGKPMSGEDRRQLFLHRDSHMLPTSPSSCAGMATPRRCSWTQRR